MDSPFFSFSDKDLRCIEACAQPCFGAVPRKGTTLLAASRLWTTVLLCRIFPQSYPLTRPRILLNSPPGGHGIHCSILEHSVVSPLKTTTWKLSTEECMSCSQRYPVFVGRTPPCSAPPRRLHEAVGTFGGGGRRKPENPKKIERNVIPSPFRIRTARIEVSAKKG